MNKLKLNLNQTFGPVVTAMLLSLVALAVSAANNPPHPDEAMKVSYQILSQDRVRVNFKLMDDVYLYQHAFGFSGEDLVVDEAQLTIPKGKEKDDPAFGLVETYYDEVSIDVPVKDIGNAPKLMVKYQGCVENYICRRRVAPFHQSKQCPKPGS